MNQHEIRSLRRRLGWSLAEMARHMGCSLDLARSWEEGSLAPDPVVINQLHYLHDQNEISSHNLQQVPLAEREMEARGMAQLTHGDLLKDIL